MTNLDVLFASLENAEIRMAAERNSIDDKIQTALNAQYCDWTELHEAISRVQYGTDSKYFADECGEIQAWTKFEALSNVPAREHHYLDSYLSEYGVYIDWSQDILAMSLGGDEITIQSEHGRDNGVYQSHKLILDEGDYTIDGDYVDVALRNRLIEEHMERTGCFPEIFSVSQYGDITPVKTTKES